MHEEAVQDVTYPAQKKSCKSGNIFLLKCKPDNVGKDDAREMLQGSRGDGKAEFKLEKPP